MTYSIRTTSELWLSLVAVLTSPVGDINYLRGISLREGLIIKVAFKICPSSRLSSYPISSSRPSRPHAFSICLLRVVSHACFSSRVPRAPAGRCRCARLELFEYKLLFLLRLHHPLCLFAPRDFLFPGLSPVPPLTPSGTPSATGAVIREGAVLVILTGDPR